MYKLGEVKLPKDEDFDYVKTVCENDEGWKLDYNKNNLKVWLKYNELSRINMIRLKADFNDISAKCLYDVIQDGDYRFQWDEDWLDGIEVCYVSDNSDIGYYAIRFPKPLQKRDFVVQRFWKDYGENAEKICFNHSVNHAKFPSKKTAVRGLSYLTATLILPKSSDSCTIYYVTQSDPGGSIPTWIVNFATKKYAPKFIEKLHEACLKYDKWKSNYHPDFKPWSDPKQLVQTLPKLDLNDIKLLESNQPNRDENDESKITENNI